MRICDVAIVGNDYLRSELASNARMVVVLPTCVSLPAEPKRHDDSRPVRIGWIGTRNNLPQLRSLEEPFRQLSARYADGVEFTIVCSAPYESKSIQTTFIPWSLESETASVRSFDIAIMPLADDVSGRGKCSFKAIQCMAHGIPAVVSPVGMNIEVVQHGLNGFLATTAEEWVEHLSSLVDDAGLRSRLGAAARKTIVRSYSYARALPAIRAAMMGQPLESTLCHRPPAD
jgi:glycosyltransferase involved in cell wall biosynthesis